MGFEEAIARCDTLSAKIATMREVPASADMFSQTVPVVEEEPEVPKQAAVDPEKPELSEMDSEPVCCAATCNGMTRAGN